MKLISMTDFVLKQTEDNNKQRLNKYTDIICYANFLDQPLKIEMFIPCDEDGNVLEECNEICSCECDKIKEYRKAKEKVLFENYSVVKQSTYSIVVDSHGRNVWLSWNESKTIESLINEVTEVSLTPNAIKRIFG